MIELKAAYQDGGAIKVQFDCSGGTNALIDELATGAARILVTIADDLPSADELHESLARIFGAQVVASVGQILAERDEQGQAADKPADA